MEAWWNAILLVTPMGAGSGTLTRLGLAKAGTELVAAGRALSRAAAAKGRETVVQQGARVLTTSRHAATGSRASAAAHDFAAAGLDFAHVAAAVGRDIVDLSQLAPGIGRVWLGSEDSRLGIERGRLRRKELEALPDVAVARVARALDALPSDPRPRGCKKLCGASDLWRVRVGDYRIIYRVDDHARLIEVRAIRDRKDAYE